MTDTRETGTDRTPSARRSAAPARGSGGKPAQSRRGAKPAAAKISAGKISAGKVGEGKVGEGKASAGKAGKSAERAPRAAATPPDAKPAPDKASPAQAAKRTADTARIATARTTPEIVAANGAAPTRAAPNSKAARGARQKAEIQPAKATAPKVTAPKAAAPKAEAAKPKAVAAKPKAEAAKPKAEAAKPKAEAAKPKVAVPKAAPRPNGMAKTTKAEKKPPASPAPAPKVESKPGTKAKPVAKTAKAPVAEKKPAAETKPVASPAPAATVTGEAGQKPVGVAAPRPVAEAGQKPALEADQKPAGDRAPLPIDLERLTSASTGILAESGKASAAVLRAFETGERASLAPDESVDVAKTLGSVAEYWIKDPTRLVEAQKNISLDVINLWHSMLRQVGGEPPADPAPPAKDPRFADPEWSENPYFNFMRQAHALGTRWASDLVDRAEDLDEHTKRKARFYVRQLASAFSPSNFVLTNPELLRTTIQEHGENLARGMKMLAEDIEAGKGELRIRQTDATRFKVGENLANTPGKVVFRNELIELIQYTPTTETVYKRPLLIVPPWINKFYILDLNAEKSFIRWAVSEGITVFVVSWINPDERHRSYDFESYMRRGVLQALDVVESITGEPDVDAIGYCVGGTLLAVTLAWIAQDARPDRIASATFFTTQVDFTHAGELLAFVDEAQIKSVEDIMARLGYLPGEKMASAFNMLRPNDLIWSYMVNNYLKGKQPAPFDLLYWNSDSTRMAEANHSFYLRNCYLKNRLARHEMTIGGRLLDLGRITKPIYNLAAKEDHIAPAKSVFVGSKLFGGPVTYVMAGSGHIAGVINPVSKPKYQYWTGGAVQGEFEAWVGKAEEHPGTWWPHWLAWLTRGQSRVPARAVGNAAFPPLEDAPGSYVRMRS